MTQAREPEFPTHKVINSFQTNECFTNFNFYLTSVKIEKKLGKNLVVSFFIITFGVGKHMKAYPEAVGFQKWQNVN